MGYSSELVQKVAGYMKVYTHTHTHTHTHPVFKRKLWVKIQIRKSPAYRWKQRVWIKSPKDSTKEQNSRSLCKLGNTCNLGNWGETREDENYVKQDHRIQKEQEGYS